MKLSGECKSTHFHEQLIPVWSIIKAKDAGILFSADYIHRSLWE